MLAGGLAAGALRPESNFWLQNRAALLLLAMLWLLFDPLLGTVWHFLLDRQLARRLTDAARRPKGAVRPLLPYTAKGSAGYRLSAAAAALREHDGEWQTLLLLTLIAGGVAFWLGPVAGVCALLSLGLAIWVAGRPAPHSASAHLWHSVSLLLLPYAATLGVLGNVTGNALLPALGYGVVHWGNLQRAAGEPGGERAIMLGQGAMAAYLFAAVHPLAALVVSLGGVFTLLANRQPAGEPPADKAQRIQPFLLAGLLAAAMAVGGGG
ncbi:MAG: hypothetical protein D6796_07895 [Caldilineae bacterium]|nr:MAG: hypothetical protein D6796_07895 [Caldilineae bacterium]